MSSHNIKERFEEALDNIPPKNHADAITAAMHMHMTEDDALQRCLIDLSMRLRKETTVKGLDNYRAIVLNITEDDFKYEPFVLFIGILEFIFYLARKAVDMQKISALEYHKFRELMQSIGFPHLGFVEYSKHLGSRQREVEQEIEKKELARLKLLDKHKNDAETLKYLEELNLLKPIATQEIDRAKISKETFYDLIDEYCKFSVLGEQGMPLKVVFMKYVLEELGIIPGLNSGYSIIDFLERNKDESMKEFKERVAELCGNITKKLYKDLGESPEKDRVGIMPVSLGELLIQGILPSTELEIMDKNPQVQAFMANLRKGAKSQIKDDGSGGKA